MRRRADLTFTLDIEDHRPPHADWPARYPDLTYDLLDWLDERCITATMFVVGEVGEHHPGLVKEISARGHEIGLHNWKHVQLTKLDPTTFEQWVKRGKAVLEDLSDQEVVGFRAPTASIVPGTMWTTDILAQEGFVYTSSIVPGRSPLHSFPGAPSKPFRWPSGVVELGLFCPGFGSWRVPFGGTCLRLLPTWSMAMLLRISPPREGAGLYCHPYDFDLDEPRWHVDDAGRLGFLTWRGRAGMKRKVEAIFDRYPAAPPLRDRIEGVTSWVDFSPSLADGATRWRPRRIL
ncbi:MAG: polysaccharide deacetylase family protein [Actinobacteria bacterium]|nr:polysaccharide deacetylase family protein [Actinomycetota bacterium]